MTTENLKSALEYAVELNEHGLEILTAADGTEYYDANKFNLKELDPKRYPKTLELSTLTSLVDYLKTDLNNLKNQRLIVAVEKNDEVCVWSENDELERRTLLVDVKARVPELSFGRFLSSEQFNIMLQSNFIDDNDRGTLLEFASALKIENGADAKAKRKVTITLTMSANEERTVVDTAMEVKSKFAPQNGVATTILIGRDFDN